MGDFNGENYQDQFVGKLVNFVANDKFQSLFENFFLTHALKFGGEEEHKLVYTEIYQQFHDMFDKQLEDFCAQMNMTQGDFMKRCRAAATEDPKASHYINILLSSVEYETFVKLMKIMRPVAQHRLSAPTSTAADSKPSAKESDDDYSPSKAAAGGSKAIDSPSKAAGPPVYADSKVTGADFTATAAAAVDDVPDAKNYSSSSMDNKSSSSK